MKIAYWVTCAIETAICIFIVLHWGWINMIVCSALCLAVGMRGNFRRNLRRKP